MNDHNPRRVGLGLVLAATAGLVLFAVAPAGAQTGPLGGPPSCTEPADPNQGPPSNPPEDTPLRADPAEPGDCPDEDGSSVSVTAGDDDDGVAGASGTRSGTAGATGADGAEVRGAQVSTDVSGDAASDTSRSQLATTGSTTTAAAFAAVAALVLGAGAGFAGRRLRRA